MKDMIRISSVTIPSLAALLIALFSLSAAAQDFYFGADLSYVNELEDCGVVYRENGVPKDPFAIFAGHGANLIRLRLWHTPGWYDNLNDGNRYSDLADVRKSIQRAKQLGMDVLLDFHLSDNWADPGNQLVPSAWVDVVDDLPVLKDSLAQYVFNTLIGLDQDGLLPEMVQIGNETNKGILLSPDDNATWTLDWQRNAELFNAALQAVADAETVTGQTIKKAIHIAGPSSAGWFVDQFTGHGVTDFEIIGISYYWAWHMPTSIEETGEVIESLKSAYPEKEVMIFETGYPWTLAWNDNANNIMTELHPDYAPASPAHQLEWLIDLTAEVRGSGGKGVIYWEPAWVSSECWTQWGQGSHQEHVTFFDFDNNLLSDGGVGWMEFDYSTTVPQDQHTDQVRMYTPGLQPRLIIDLSNSPGFIPRTLVMSDLQGHQVWRWPIILQPGTGQFLEIDLSALPSGMYLAQLRDSNGELFSKKIVICR